MKKIAVIGGGASGLVAAIAAARTNPQAQILIYEKKDSAGKKILAICPAIWYTVPVTVVRGWEYARISGKPFPAAVPLAHKIL